MPSNKETLFQNHICAYLEENHKYSELSNKVDKYHHFISSDIVSFVQNTQPTKYEELKENYGSDTDREIIKALEQESLKTPLWLIIRDGITVKGTMLQLYAQKPRSKTNSEQEKRYRKNKLTYKKEYYYNTNSQERVDLVIWLNGLPIIVIELKHEDEGQNVDDAIYDSFLERDLDNRLYKNPFLYLAVSNTEAKRATDPTDFKNFWWFNACLSNKSETEGEYPVEYIYKHVLSKENICHYLEHYLVFVPAVEKQNDDGEWMKKQNS